MVTLHVHVHVLDWEENKNNGLHNSLPMVELEREEIFEILEVEELIII